MKTRLKPFTSQKLEIDHATSAIFTIYIDRITELVTKLEREESLTDKEKMLYEKYFKIISLCHEVKHKLDHLSWSITNVEACEYVCK